MMPATHVTNTQTVQLFSLDLLASDNDAWHPRWARQLCVWGGVDEYIAGDVDAIGFLIWGPHPG